MTGFMRWSRICIGKWTRKFRRRPLVPVALSFLILLVISDHFIHRKIDPRLLPLVGERGRYVGVLTESPRTTDYGLSFPVRLESEETLGEVKGKVLLSEELVNQPERVQQGAGGLAAGDKIFFSARLKRPTWYKNPGGFNYRRSLERKGLLLRGYLKGDRDLTILTHHPSALGKLRHWIRGKIFSFVEFPAAPVLASLLTGETTLIPPSLMEDFRKTGTAHLLAISGQNVGMVALFFYFPILWLLKRSYRLMHLVSVRSLATLLTLLPVFVYVGVAGSPVSAVRAGMVAVLIAVALAGFRPFDLLSALSLAALAIGLVSPASVFGASFQLSFAAIMAIGLLAPRIARRIPGPRWFAFLVAQTVAATIGTFPFLLYHFGQIPLTGILTNLWAVPFMTLLLGLLIFSIFIAPWTGIGLKVTGFLAHWFLWGIQKSALFSFLLSFTFPLIPDHLLRVHFIDVGEGDAALIQTSHGRNILIDAGGFLIPGKPSSFDVGEKVVVPYLKRWGVKKIDLLILSHPHPDHYGGMRAVLREFPVGEFLGNGDRFPDESFDQMMSEIEQIPVKRGVEGMEEKVDDLTFHILAPDHLGRDINDNSLVIRVTSPGVSFLFPGDAGRSVEERLVGAVGSAGLASDVVKVPHHGSKTASSVGFIEAVQPRFAVVSLGEGNMFHFPAPGILERYERRGARLFRTDQNGTVIFEWDGKELRAEPFISE